MLNKQCSLFCYCNRGILSIVIGFCSYFMELKEYTINDGILHVYASCIGNRGSILVYIYSDIVFCDISCFFCPPEPAINI